jgi:Big-like domain-containing protein
VNGGPPQLSIGNPLEGSNVSASGGKSYTITGAVTDPVAGAGAIDSVEVWIFGEKNTRGATNLGTATVLSDGSWSLTFLPTRFTSTHTNIYVYAHSKATGLETVASRGFNIVG